MSGGLRQADAHACADQRSVAAMLIGETLNRVTHFIDDTMRAGSTCAHADFFQHAALGGDGRYAQVGAAEIDGNGEVGHNGRE